MSKVPHILNHPQSISRILPTCFMYIMYLIFLVSYLKPRYFQHFAAMPSSSYIGCLILGFWNMPCLTAWIWILHHFAPFVLGKFPLEPLETCRMVLCQCRCINTTNLWPWNSENRCCDLFNFSSRISQEDKGWYQRSLKTSRRKFMEKLRNSMY